MYRYVFHLKRWLTLNTSYLEIHWRSFKGDLWVKNMNQTAFINNEKWSQFTCKVPWGIQIGLWHTADSQLQCLCYKDEHLFCSQPRASSRFPTLYCVTHNLVHQKSSSFLERASQWPYWNPTFYFIEISFQLFAQSHSHNPSVSATTPCCAFPRNNQVPKCPCAEP